MKDEKEKKPITLSLDDLVDEEKDIAKGIDIAGAEDIEDTTGGQKETAKPEEEKSSDFVKESDDIDQNASQKNIGDMLDTDELNEENSEEGFFNNETDDNDNDEIESQAEKVADFAKNKWANKVLVVLIALFISCGGYLTYALTHTHKEPVVWQKEKIEYGTKNFDPIKELNGVDLVFVDKVDTKTVGEYNIEAIVKDQKTNKIKKYKHHFIVEDTKAPIITTSQNSLTITAGEKPNYNLLRIKAKDPVDGKVSYIIQDGGLSTIGDHRISIKATDFNGNTTVKRITVHVEGFVTKSGLDTYRQKVAWLKDTFTKEQKAKEDAEKAVEAKKSASGRILWIGDSRFVGMSQTCSSDKDVYIAKGGVEYSWFTNTAVNEANSKLQDGDTIIVNIGINGLEYEKLADRLNQLADGDWKNYKVIFMSVNPVDEEKETQNGYSTTNDDIKEFNSYMKQHLVSNITYLDTYSSLVDDISSRTADGLHYSTGTNQSIYNMGRAAIDK